jgi:triosephosphate isomerase (TIM)
MIVGNWKMHGLTRSLDEVRALAASLETRAAAARVAICPPTTLISRMAAALAGSLVMVGAQDCRAEPEGAFTGDVSPEMLVDAGAALVILGHSERRLLHAESDAAVSAKVLGALRAGLEPIVCVGESLDHRRSGQAVEVVLEQVRRSLPEALSGVPFAVAYEPVWAIGSGLTPRVEEIEEVHGAIRKALGGRFGARARNVPILYGGSVSPVNAPEILHARDVGGALVGGASLRADEFEAIIAAA